METKDLITLIISSCALLMSVISLYRSHFRKPKISIIPGPEVHLYYQSSNGAPGLYLPVIVANESATPGFIWRIMVALRDTSGNDFYFNWTEEVETNKDFSEYRHKERVKPFAVPASSAIPKMFWFYTNAHPTGKNLKWTEGRFELRTFAWTKNGAEQPSHVKLDDFLVSHEAAAALADNLANKKGATRFLYLKGGVLLAAQADFKGDHKKFFTALSTLKISE